MPCGELTLSILGGGAAWWLARAALRIYSAAQAGNDMPLDITMGGAVLCYLIAISICTGFVVGFITGTHLAGLNINESTNGGGRGISGNKRSKRLSDFFVAGEMVLAVALLAIAAIIVRSFLKVYTAGHRCEYRLIS